MDVFNGRIGARVSFDYYTTSRGGLRGTTRSSSQTFDGIFVAEGGATLATSQEVTTGAPLLYVRPTDTFATKSVLGDQVKVNDILYEITGWGEGRRQMDNRLVHIELTLGEVNDGL